MATPVGPAEAEQHCYRHADRRAGVRCQRCDRPICPSCMITASVGFQCPECAKQGAKQQRLVDVYRRTTAPHLTYALIAINVAIYAIGAIGGQRFGGVTGDLADRFGLAAKILYVNGSGATVDLGQGVAYGQWWRIVTSGFLHAGVLHVALNMYVLYLIGGAMERVIGKARFGLIYAVSLIGGSLGALLLTPDALTVGASGAIFGLFAALACLELSRGQNPMKGGIGPTIMLNLVITLVFGLGSGAGGIRISIGGHLGGLVAGAICGALLFGLTPQHARSLRGRDKVTMPVLAVIGLLLFAGAIAAGHALA